MPDQPVNVQRWNAGRCGDAGDRFLKSGTMGFRAAAGMAADSTDHARTTGSRCPNPGAMAVAKTMPDADWNARG